MPFESTGPASVIPLSEQTYRDRNGLADIYGDGNMGGGLADIYGDGNMVALVADGNKGGVGGGHMDGRVGPSRYRRQKNFRQTEIFTI